MSPRPLRVAFDARHASRGLGIATFISSLAEGIVHSGACELTWLGDAEYAPTGTTRCVPVHRLPYPVLDSWLGHALVRSLDVDLVHFTGNTGWARQGPVPTVLTLHDLIFLRSHGRDRSTRQIVGHAYERWLIRRAVSCADRVVVPSNTVAADVVEHFGSRVAPQVIYEGTPPSEMVAPASAARPYVVVFAGRDPRKGTVAAVAGWSRARDLPLDLKLLSSAGVPDGLRGALASDIAAGRVEIHDHLGRRELTGVLAGALALIYPSTDEGFGLPVVEAMAAGAPVLGGLAPVTREIGAEALIQLDPDDVPGSIDAALRRLYQDPGYRRTVIELGRVRARSFTWRSATASYVGIYRELGGSAEPR